MQGSGTRNPTIRKVVTNQRNHLCLVGKQVAYHYNTLQSARDTGENNVLEINLFAKIG